MAKSAKGPKKSKKKNKKEMSGEEKQALFDKHQQELIALVNKKLKGAKAQKVILKKKGPHHEEIRQFNKAIQSIPGMENLEFYSFDEPGAYLCPGDQRWCYAYGAWGCYEPGECGQ